MAANSGVRRDQFWRLVFGGTNGYVCISFLDYDTRKFWDRYYHWPEDAEKMDSDINNKMSDCNIYFCPNVFGEPKRAKSTVRETPTAWADLDTCHPDLMKIAPTITIESSPGRFQALWRLKDADPDIAESISRRIAYAHADEGADKSGWDLTQLLRVPHTENYKYLDELGAPRVQIREVTRRAYSVESFDVYPPGEDEATDGIPVPEPEVLQGLDPDALLQERRTRLNPMLWKLYNEEPIDDWSKALWNLELLCFEAGFNREEAFVICQNAKCNKYVRDGRDVRLLWREVCRAYARGEKTASLLGPANDFADVELLSPEERARVKEMAPGFVERYIEWARTLGDAAPQYHQAGAFIVLSSLLAGHVRLPTSFGNFIPNLWFMILADTTLTRKSTAMDIAMDLVDQVDPELVLATDGSVEGLMTSLSLRPGRPSVFLRDEFSGLLDAMTKKDYMAGTAESLTKLYDGKMQKRILRKETIEVRDPVLIIFAGGIKDKVCGLLTFEQVSSGFMPRFIFITAESDIKKLKPLGPPTERLEDNKQQILREMHDLVAHYHQTMEMEVPMTGNKITQKLTVNAHLTSGAWVRYNQLESEMLQAGLASENRADVLTPTYDRLSKSMLKAAVLLAAARQRGEQIVVTEDDILRAIAYGEQWKRHGDEVMANVGLGTNEKTIKNILALIEREPGVMRGRVMQHYHLDSRSATHVLDTMEQRGLIVRRKVGKGEQLYANTRSVAS